MKLNQEFLENLYFLYLLYFLARVKYQINLSFVKDSNPQLAGYNLFAVFLFFILYFLAHENLSYFYMYKMCSSDIFYLLANF